MELVFIGFGEAAYHISRGLRSTGDISLGAYDANAQHPANGPLIRQRAAELGVSLFDSAQQACADARFIVCLTSASSALAVAQSLIPLLRPGQTYVDMNSAAPTVKQSIEQLPRASGVGFCDCAVMGTVPGNGHTVPMLLAGNGAAAFAARFTPLGMRLNVLHAEPGAASALKMLKSVVMKGLPQLLLESFVAAERFGVLDSLVTTLGDSLNGKTVEQLADTFCARTLLHAERRSAEMADVVATLQALGVDASLSQATQARLAALAEQNWNSLLGPGASDMGYAAAIKHLAHHV